MSEVQRLEREIRRLELELSRSIDQLPRLRQMVEFADDMLLLVGGDGRVLEYNRCAAERLAVARDALYGRPLSELLDDEDPSSVELPAALEALASGDSLRRRVVLSVNGSASLVSEVRAHCVVEGGVRTHILAARDLSTDEAREAAYVRARSQVEELRGELETRRAAELASRIESIGLLAGTLAHDLNNALTVMSANIQMLGMELTDPEHLELVAEFEDSISRAHGLSNRFLTFSKGGVVMRRPTDLGEAVTALVTSLAQTYRMACHFDVADDIPLVEVDLAQLTQVITNLIVNAHQAMDGDGALWVGCHATHRPQGPDGQPAGAYAAVSIRDNGSGIAPEALPKIFEPFFTTKRSGSGLGLAGAYRILKAHDGWIDVRSTVGEGTCFELMIPLSKRRVQSVTSSFRGLATPDAPVLVVDDEAPVRQALKRLLGRLGTEIVEAGTGDEAVARYEEMMALGAPPSLTILDVSLGVGDNGIDVLARLQAIDPQVRAIACSGYSELIFGRDFETLGFVDYLQKPFTLTQLKGALERALA